MIKYQIETEVYLIYNVLQTLFKNNFFLIFKHMNFLHLLENFHILFILKFSNRKYIFKILYMIRNLLGFYEIYR